MLEPSWSDTRRSQAWLMNSNSETNEACHFTDHWPSMEKRTTVKDMLKKKRQLQDEIFQKWRNHQEDYISEHEVKMIRSEAYTSSQSPQQIGNVSPMNLATTPSLNLTQVNLTPAPVDFNPAVMTLNPAPDFSLYFPPSASVNQIPQSVPLVLSAPSEDGKVTLFQWQVQQQLTKMKGVSTELLNMQDSDGDTSLHIAVAQGRRALAYVLAANMAASGTLDMKEHNGQTALHVAVATNQHLIVCDLLQHGAQINTRDVWGRSPLHVCVEKGHCGSLQSIFKTLFASGKRFDVDMVNYEGLTPLHTAVLSHNAVIREIARLERCCQFADTEALVKKRQMYFECIKILLQMGSSCGAKDQKSGSTSLHMAAEEANAHLIKLFLNQPSTMVFLNLRTFSGNTALHIVCALENVRGQVEAVKYLIRRGADRGVRNLENELPCQLVPAGPTGEMVRQILKGNV